MVRFVVRGRPVSIQSSAPNRARWTAQVQAAARARCAQALDGDDLRIRITFFYEAIPDFDTDNTSKPICDALNGIVYADDHQLENREARRKDINGSYRMEGADEELVQAIADGQDFVYVEVWKTTPAEGEQL